MWSNPTGSNSDSRDPLTDAPVAAGKNTAESIDCTVQDRYWERNYSSRAYAAGITYKQFRPAYRYGWESAAKANGKSFDDLAPELEKGWAKARAGSMLGWDNAKHAIRDAWDHITRPSRMTASSDRADAPGRGV